MMNTFCPSRYALGIGLVVVMLAGCNGSQAGAPGVTPQSVMLQSQAHLASPSSGDLLYVANEGAVGNLGEDVSVLTYPEGQPVMTISGIGVPWGICSDTSGNVWVVTTYNTVYEFAHGVKTPMRSLQIPNSILSTGCTVDPTTGNLAVIVLGVSGTYLDVWAQAEGTPAVYSPPFEPVGCAYDNQGNLFIDGASGSQSLVLAELQKGASTFTNISLNKSGHWGGGLEWDGRYVAVNTRILGAPKGHGDVIYRVRVSGSNGTVMQTVPLRDVEQTFWFWVQGNTVIAVMKSGYYIGLFNYPKGGRNNKKLSPFYAPWGITVSVSPLSLRIRK
jgi:hypothetical protein